MRPVGFALGLLFTFLTPTLLFAAPGDLQQILQPGLTKLFDGKLSPADSEAIIEEARAFKESFDRHLTQIPQVLQNLKWTQKGLQMAEFSVPSLVSRPGHPSNQLVGQIYFPVDTSDCVQKYPATLILHHVGDDLGPEKQLAKLAASGKQGIVMLIYLPDYGPRRRGSEAFITNDVQTFRRNVLQALLDTRLAYEILKRQPDVDTDHLKLMGISLGGVLGLMSAGIDPVFNHYGILVGGADVAHIMAYRKESSPKSETSLALKEIDWTVEEARRKLAHLDSLTWAGNVHGKKILLMNAKNDELINPKLGVEKIADLLRANGNEVDVQFHAGGHRPDRKTLGLWGLFKDIYMPTMRFFSDGKTTCH